MIEIIQHILTDQSHIGFRTIEKNEVFLIIRSYFHSIYCENVILICKKNDQTMSVKYCEK